MKKNVLLACLVILVGLNGCGGGGGGGGTATTSTVSTVTNTNTSTSTGTSTGTTTGTTTSTSTGTTTGTATATATATSSSTGVTTNTTTSSGTNYYPLTVGSKWSHSSYPDTVSSVIWNYEVMADGRRKEFANSINGVDYYHTFMADSTGVYYVKSESLGASGPSTITHSNHMILPANLSTGGVFNFNYTTTSSGVITNIKSRLTVIGYETITVKAGTFLAVKIKTDFFDTSGAVTGAMYTWYAPNVGQVASGDNSGNITGQLISYSIK